MCRQNHSFSLIILWPVGTGKQTEAEAGGAGHTEEVDKDISMDKGDNNVSKCVVVMRQNMSTFERERERRGA